METKTTQITFDVFKTEIKMAYDILDTLGEYAKDILINELRAIITHHPGVKSIGWTQEGFCDDGSHWAAICCTEDDIYINECCVEDAEWEDDESLGKTFTPIAESAAKEASEVIGLMQVDWMKDWFTEDALVTVYPDKVICL